MSVTEVFGGNVDWFSSTKVTSVTSNADSISSWTNVNAPLSAVSNGHIDVWPTLTSSGALFYSGQYHNFFSPVL